MPAPRTPTLPDALALELSSLEADDTHSDAIDKLIVLVIGGSSSDLLLLKEGLANHLAQPVELVHTASATDGLRKAQEILPDLAIIEGTLPGLDVPDMYRSLLDLPLLQTVSVLLLVDGRVDQGAALAIRAPDEGVTRVLVRPLTPDKLRLVLADLLPAP